MPAFPNSDVIVVVLPSQVAENFNLRYYSRSNSNSASRATCIVFCLGVLGPLLRRFTLI